MAREGDHSVITFYFNEVIEIICVGYLSLNESPHNALVIVWEDEALKSPATPFYVLDAIDIHINCSVVNCLVWGGVRL